jgi:hypothetical protein
VNRLDQHPHAGEQGFGLVDLRRRAATSQRAVGGGAAFGDIGRVLVAGLAGLIAAGGKS